MLEWLLSCVFPPKLGKIEQHDTSVLLHAIDSGEIEVCESDPPEAGCFPAKEWRNGAWRPIKKKLTPFTPTGLLSRDSDS
jgi:hypothetical protein